MRMRGGKAYIAGACSTGATFGKHKTGGDGFITRVTGSGEFDWLESIPDAVAASLALGPDGSIYVTGLYRAGDRIGGRTLLGEGVYVWKMPPPK
jgi:hypothetical protein